MAIKSGGELDRRITIRRMIESGRNEFNEKVFSWFDLATVWARRRDATDQERFEAAQVTATLMSRFVVRFSSVTKTVTASDRLLYDGAEWDINGVKETAEGRDRFLEITATKVAN